MKNNRVFKYSNIFFFLLILNACSGQQSFDINLAPNNPELLKAIGISTGQYERDFALSPRGDELFYTLQSPGGKFQTIIQRIKEKNGKWSDPKIASFAGNFSDLEPAFSPDGQRLYFVSNRPISGNEIKDFDIWFVDKIDGVWKNPTNIGAPINTPADEFYPSITKSGNIYFTAAYNEAVSKEDIFVAVYDDGKYLSPIALDSAVNSILYEFNAFVSPDEDYIIFTSYGRKDDAGRGDLYMSLKDQNGHWQTAQNLKNINSDRLDYCPFVSFDRKVFFFTSERNTLKSSYSEKPINYKELLKDYTSPQNGGGDIYWMSFKQLMEQFKNK